MMKLVIFGGFLLLSCIAQASPAPGDSLLEADLDEDFKLSPSLKITDNLKEKIHEVKEKVDTVVDGLLIKVQNEVVVAKEKLVSQVLELRESGVAVTTGVISKVTKILKKVDEKIAELTKQANGVNVTECTALSATLKLDAINIIVNASRCVVDKIEEASSYTVDVVSSVDQAISTLIGIKDDSQVCTKDVQGFGSAIKAFLCVNKVLAKANWESANMVPEITIYIAKISSLVATLQVDLEACAINRALQTLAEQAENTIEKIEDCVNSKIKH